MVSTRVIFISSDTLSLSKVVVEEMGPQ